MQLPQSASKYLILAETLRKLATELGPTDSKTAASLLEMASEYVVKAEALKTTGGFPDGP